MKIQHLRFLTAVVDYGGVIKAAERLHRAQPTISAGLKALEQELGQPLFDRSLPPNRALQLTPAGRRFYRNALQILQQCDAARADFLGEVNAQPSLRVAVLDTLSQEVIVNTFGALARLEPKLQVDIWEGSAAQVAKWLAQGRVDLAWTNVNDLTPTARVLWREPLVAVVARNHPFAKLGGQITLRDIEAYPFVHRSRCELDAVGRAQLKAAGVKLQVTARAEREDLAYRLIRNSKALTLAPKSLIPQDLVALTVSDLRVARIIGLQWREKVDASLLTTISDACAEAMQTMEQASINAKRKTSKKPRAKRA